MLNDEPDEFGKLYRESNRCGCTQNEQVRMNQFLHMALHSKPPRRAKNR